MPADLLKLLWLDRPLLHRKLRHIHQQLKTRHGPALMFPSIDQCGFVLRLHKDFIGVIEFLDDVHRIVLHPSNQRKAKLLRRLLCNRHNVGAKVLGKCDDLEIRLGR